MKMQYLRLAEGLSKYKLVPTTDNIWNHIKNPSSKDYYVSLYLYNDEHYKTWKETNTVSGLSGVVTNRLYFDFDDSANIDNARQDAVVVVTRLLEHGLPQNAIQVNFSGNKGFSVEVDTTDNFTPEEFKSTVFALADGLTTFDKVVNDSQRLVRLTGTKHMKSGLYKMPLSISQLTELPIETIKDLAKDYDSNVDKDLVNSYTEVQLPSSIKKYKVTAKKETVEIKFENTELDLSRKPKWLSPAKFALQEGFFGAGERNTAFMILATSYKNQGFSKEIVYRMLKGVAERQAARNNVDRYSDKELWGNIVDVVYSPTWKGGTYSYDNTPLLQEVTKRLGLKRETENKEELLPVESVTGTFKDFALNIDKNTIKLGIDLIDNNVTVTTSMLTCLLASPSAGKTAISLGILNSNSLRQTNSIFFSLDMGAPLVYQRLIQKHTGMGAKDIFKAYKNNDLDTIKLMETAVTKNYSNVKFSFKSGVTVDMMRDMIVGENDKGNKIRLVVIDYLECITGPFSDATANSSFIAQQLKDLANELELTILLLVQPQKQAGDPSDELLSYRKIKGSSAIEQAASVIFTLWRPGFNPKNAEEDKYASIAVVKNRMGALNKFDFAWEGLRGELTELDEYEKDELQSLVNRRQKEKMNNDLI